MALSEKLRRQTSNDIPSIDIKTIDLTTADEETEIKTGNQLFKMVSRIVREGQAAASKCLDQESEVSEKDIGRGITIQCEKIYTNTCRIGENVLIHHHNKTEHGLGGFEFNENQAWINLGQRRIFDALWGWDSIDGKSLFISTTEEAKNAYSAIQDIYQELIEEETAKDQQ